METAERRGRLHFHQSEQFVLLRADRVARASTCWAASRALFYVDVQALRLSLGPAKRTAIDISAIFWHFLDGLWLYLMVLFYVWG